MQADRQQQVGEQFQPDQAQYQVEQGYSGGHKSQMYQQIGVDHQFGDDQHQSGGEHFQDVQQDAGPEEQAVQTYADPQQQAGGQGQVEQLFPGAEQSQDSQQSQEAGEWNLSESVQEFLDQLPVDESAQIHAPRQQPSKRVVFFNPDAPDGHVEFFDQFPVWTAEAQRDASQQQALQDNQQPGELWDGQAQDFEDQSYFNQALPYDEAEGDVE